MKPHAETEMSLEEFKEMLVKHWTHAIDELEEGWCELGLTNQLLYQRRHMVANLSKDVCEKVIADEHALKDRLRRSIDDNRQQIEELVEVLGDETITEPEDLGLHDLEQFLSHAKEKLLKKQHEYMMEMDKLSIENKNVCSYLGVASYRVPNDANLMNGMVEIKKHTMNMKIDEGQQTEIYHKLRKDILRYVKLLENSFDADELIGEVVHLERAKSLSKSYLQDVGKLHSDLEFQVREVESELLVTKEKIDSLWSLLQIPKEEQADFPEHDVTPSALQKMKAELERLQEMRKQHLGTVLEQMRNKLDQIWDKCHVGELTRTKLGSLLDEISEEAFNQMESELQRWTAYYDANSVILDKMSQFLGLFDDMLQMEEKSKDPTRLFNSRGGSLLQEEKDRKRIQVELPKLENQLLELGTKYKEEKGLYFMVQDEPIDQYLAKLWDIHNSQKKQEKTKVNTPRITPSKRKPPTPGIMGSGRKGPREGDESGFQGGRSGSRRLPRTTSASNFRSPVKSVRRNLELPPSGPGRTPSLRSTLSTANLPNPDLQTTLTYNKFRSELHRKSDEDCYSSTLVDSLVDPLCKDAPRTPTRDRRKGSKSALNKRTPKTPVRGGSSGGAFLGRTQSQSSLTKMRTPTKKPFVFR